LPVHAAWLQATLAHAKLSAKRYLFDNYQEGKDMTTDKSNTTGSITKDLEVFGHKPTHAEIRLAWMMSLFLFAFGALCIALGVIGLIDHIHHPLDNGFETFASMARPWVYGLAILGGVSSIFGALCLIPPKK